MFAWLLFRITGLALVLYLVMHIHVIGSLHDPETFDKTMAFLGSWQFRILEIGLLAAILVHAMNGIRVFIVDFCKGSLYHARLFWILFVVGLFLLGAGAYPMFTHALHARKTADTTQLNIKVSDSLPVVGTLDKGERHAEKQG